MLSTSEALSAYRQSRVIAKQVAADTGLNAKDLWGEHWFPLFTFEGDYYVVFGSKTHTLISPVYFVANEDQTPVKKYESHTEMMEILARCYTEGAFFVDEANVLEEDPRRVNQVIRQYRATAGTASAAEDRIVELVDQLAKGNGHARSEALSALVELKDERAIEPLTQVLATGNEFTRVLAARVLGDLRLSKASKGLVTAITDPSAAVRAEVVEALGKIRAKDTIDPLIEALSDPDLSVRMRYYCSDVNQQAEQEAT